MSGRSNRQRLKDMLQAIQRARSYTQGLTYTTFQSDVKTQDATLRALEVLGEASKAVSDDIRQQFPEVPWKSIAGQRDKLIHHYFGVNLDIVWEVVTLDLPLLEHQIQQILNQITPS